MQQNAKAIYTVLLRKDYLTRSQSLGSERNSKKTFMAQKFSTTSKYIIYAPLTFVNCHTIH